MSKLLTSYPHGRLSVDVREKMSALTDAQLGGLLRFFIEVQEDHDDPFVDHWGEYSTEQVFQFDRMLQAVIDIEPIKVMYDGYDLHATEPQVQTALDVIGRYRIDDPVFEACQDPEWTCIADEPWQATVVNDYVMDMKGWQIFCDFMEMFGHCDPEEGFARWFAGLAFGKLCFAIDDAFGQLRPTGIL